MGISQRRRHGQELREGEGALLREEARHQSHRARAESRARPVCIEEPRRATRRHLYRWLGSRTRRRVSHSLTHFLIDMEFCYWAQFDLQQDKIKHFNWRWRTRRRLLRWKIVEFSRLDLIIVISWDDASFITREFMTHQTTYVSTFIILSNCSIYLLFFSVLFNYYYAHIFNYRKL